MEVGCLDVVIAVVDNDDLWMWVPIPCVGCTVLSFVRAGVVVVFVKGIGFSGELDDFSADGCRLLVLNRGLLPGSNGVDAGFVDCLLGRHR